MPPGEVYEDTWYGDIINYFPSATNGVYDVWWTSGDLKSNPLRFTVTNGKITLATDLSAGNAIIRPQIVSSNSIRGLVLDEDGSPIRGAKVYTATLRQWYNLQNRILWFWHEEFPGDATTTDALGYFKLRGDVTSDERIVIAPADNDLIWSVRPNYSQQDIRITLPRPAMLIVHYDIPGDEDSAIFALRPRTNESPMPLLSNDAGLIRRFGAYNGSSTATNPFKGGTSWVYPVSPGHTIYFVTVLVRFDPETNGLFIVNHRKPWQANFSTLCSSPEKRNT